MPPTTQILVIPLEEGDFGVEVTIGAASTKHRVTVPEGMLDQLDLGEAEAEDVIRESFAFLLEREPATSILPQFSLDEIGRYFPEYFQELPARLAI